MKSLLKSTCLLLLFAAGVSTFFLWDDSRIFRQDEWTLLLDEQWRQMMKAEAEFEEQHGGALINWSFPSIPEEDSTGRNWTIPIGSEQQLNMRTLNGRLRLALLANNGVEKLSTGQLPLLPIAIALTCAPIAIIAYGFAVRMLRRRNYRCVGCGYDLRGSVSPLCPECGTPCEHPLVPSIAPQP